MCVDVCVFARAGTFVCPCAYWGQTVWGTEVAPTPLKILH